jgi:hypothetical protein
MRERHIEPGFQRRRGAAAKNRFYGRFQSTLNVGELTVGNLFPEQGFDWGSERGCHDMNRRRPSKRGKQRPKAASPNANSSAPRPAANHPLLHHGGTRIQPPRRPHLPPAHTPPPQARAGQEDEDEERLAFRPE